MQLGSGGVVAVAYVNDYGLDLTSSLGTSICHGCGPKKTKKKKKKKTSRSSHLGSVETNLTRNPEVAGSIPGFAQWLKDPELLWLWHRSAATALIIRPLTLEPPYATGVALKRQKRKEKKFSTVNPFGK